MSHLSDLQLDALLGGPEAPPPHLATCAACADRYAELQADRARFADTYDVQALARATLGRRPRRTPWMLGGLSLAAAAAAVFLMIRPTPAPPDTRTKGSAAPELFVLAGGDPRPVTSAVPPMSRLQVRFDPGGKRFARVLWASPDGALGDLHPLASEPALRLDPTPGPRWLDHTLELDAEPGDETLVIVLCDHPTSHAEALERVGAPGDCAVTRVPVKKRR